MVIKAEVVNKLNHDDIVIALMGPTGAGKSNVIDVLTGQHERAGSNLKSCTDKVTAVRMKNHPLYGDRLVLIDTPGFDDTNKSDVVILQLISAWLVQSYKKQITLAGIVYLHRISDNRMPGTAYRNLRMFGQLCGTKAAANVVLVTTMWDRVKFDVGERREADLKQHFWGTMIDNGAHIGRFYNSLASASILIDEVICRRIEGMPLLLQEELVDLNRTLRETAAAQELYTQLRTLLYKKKEVIKRLEEQARSQNAPEAVAACEEELLKVQNEFENTFKAVNDLHLSFFGKMRLLFAKKPTTRAVRIN